MRPSSVIDPNPPRTSAMSRGPEADLGPLRREMAQLGESVCQLQEQQKSFKNELWDMEERLSLTIVKQFQLQQEEFKRMMEEMSVR